MRIDKRWSVVFSLVIITSLVLAACQPQVVEVEKEVVVEKVVEKAVEVEVEAAPEIAYVEVEKEVDLDFGTEEAPFIVRGIIDRIDVNESVNVRVLDYKTGANSARKDHGTKTEWRDYLAVREIQEDGSIPFKAKAIKTLIKKRHCKDRQFLVDEVFQLNDARRVYEGDITNNYKKMASNINSIYPKFLH